MNSIVRQFTVDGRNLAFEESNKKIDFPWPIAQVIELGDVMIVRVGPDNRVQA